MMEIPPAKDTDAEDVVWGLQTAETLWKRGERIDALVWLRRAAQAAGDANDDDRALELARFAAELTEWMANADDGGATGRTQAIDELDETPIEVDDAKEVAPPPSVHSAVTTAPPAASTAPPPLRPVSRPGSQSAIASPEASSPEPLREVSTVMLGAAEDAGRPSVTSVLPAEKVHAGMFDPWADQSSQLAPANPPPAPPPPPSRRSAVAPDEEEVITSVRPHALSRPGSDAHAITVPVAPSTPVAPPPPPKPSRPSSTSQPKVPPKPPPPLPPRARAPVPKPAPPAVAAPRPVEAPPAGGGEEPPRPAAPVEEAAAAPVAPPPPVVAQPSSPPAHAEAEPDDVTSADVAVPDLAAFVPSPEELESAAPPPLDAAAADAAVVTNAPVEQPGVGDDEEVDRKEQASEPAHDEKKLDLDDVEAFADLPDDARTDFAAAATIHSLAEGEEIGTFALAYVISGTFDVAATVVDAPAVRLVDGAVLRARGTTDENVPIRLICAKDNGVLATWSDVSVEEAFRTIPWVEDDLRAAADRVQTLVGITIGPLGERLDVSLREEIVGRLTMRPLIPGEVVVKEGDPVPGLLLVGIGELELVKDEKVVGQVSSGDFLFATEVLGAGSAPATARAGAGGALVMFGDRRIAQELLVTCPPLLEVFAGM